MDPFIGQISIGGWNFAPQGWAFCNGQLLSIAQNTALFSLLGTQFGGNGQTNFALPNLQGRTPIGQGQGPGLSPRTMGDTVGSASVTLTSSQMPAHGHAMTAQTSMGDRANANGAWLAASEDPLYSTAAPTATTSALALAAAGGTQPHENRQPYLAVTFVIALQGIYPSRP
ncbi:MAG: phage tail protein [Dokdonella sp.]|uniref:phage tail protein n=1 Tax=Dokdonella sp. TaxID=2291710 RepID=UPI0027B8E3AD|nr:tail fiber protein [Dokdonella sp.]MBZ0223840.1 tail fiber protein [Dokdonella sp.]MCC7254954.1 phage tail protein [Dokdonella sp.]